MTARQDLVLADAEHTQPAWAGLDHPDDIWVEMPSGGHISLHHRLRLRHLLAVAEATVFDNRWLPGYLVRRHGRRIAASP